MIIIKHSLNYVRHVISHSNINDKHEIKFSNTTKTSEITQFLCDDCVTKESISLANHRI